MTFECGHLFLSVSLIKFLNKAVNSFFMELLAPCHSLPTLKAAVKAGANAVYFGVKDFNMRMNAGNFELEELPGVVDYCHDNEVKAYLTLNVVVYEDELGDVKRLLLKAKESGVDAVIVHDLSVLKMAKDLGLECHVSTQANISNSAGVNAYADLGAARVILARELSLKQIKEVVKNSRIPIEVFVHGAMCVSISGRCFLSQAIYFKNANRGECLQPCRQAWTVKGEDGELVYDGERFLNAKDLCMIEHVPELIESGVKALKIEGRMRDANYVSTVTQCYREALDEFNKDKIEGWKERLSKVFNRGFCTGFYYSRPDAEVNLESSGNLSPYKKIEAGRVTNYFKKPGVAEISLTCSSIGLGDEVLIEGGNNFLKQIINSLEVDKKKVNKAVKGSKVGLKVNEEVKKGSIIYKLVKLD
jgi:putative protease